MRMKPLERIGPACPLFAGAHVRHRANPRRSEFLGLKLHGEHHGGRIRLRKLQTEGKKREEPPVIRILNARRSRAKCAAATSVSWLSTIGLTLSGLVESDAGLIGTVVVLISSMVCTEKALKLDIALKDLMKQASAEEMAKLNAYFKAKRNYGIAIAGTAFFTTLTAGLMVLSAKGMATGLEMGFGVLPAFLFLLASIDRKAALDKAKQELGI